MSLSATEIQNQSLPPTMPQAGGTFRRLVRFSAQMFPIFPHWVALFGGFTANFFYIYKVLTPSSADRLSAPAELTRPVLSDWLLGGISLLAMTFLLRVYDEIKDYPTDKVNFPDRPLVAGVVTHSDLHKLILATITTLFLLNAPNWNRPVFLAFIACQVFSYLMFRWFFCEKQIRASLPLALLTHHPIVFLFQAYVGSFFIQDLSSPSASPLSGPTQLMFLFLLGEGMTATAWELGRKIRGTSQEDTYTTYTKIWGTRLPPVLVCAVQWTSLALIESTLPTSHHHWIWALPKVAVVITTIQAVRFMRNPVVAPPFKAYAEYYKLALVIALLFTAFLT